MNKPTSQELDLLHANVCLALSEPVRIHILYALHEQPLHVSALAETLDLPQPTISRHLRAGFISATAALQGRTIVDAPRADC